MTRCVISFFLAWCCCCCWSGNITKIIKMKWHTRFLLMVDNHITRSEIIPIFVKSIYTAYISTSLWMLYIPTLDDRQEMVNKIIPAWYPGAKSGSPASSHPLPWRVCLHSVKHSRTGQTMCILHCLKCWLMTDLVTKTWHILYHTQRDGRAALLQVMRVISTS